MNILNNVFALFFLAVGSLGCTPAPNLNYANSFPGYQNVFGGEQISSNDLIARSFIAVPLKGPQGQAALCSGVLVSKDVVLTAAHCIVRSFAEPTEVLSVRFHANGSHYFKSIKVRSVYMHPLFKNLTKPQSDQVDVAVIILGESIESMQPVAILSVEKIHLIPKEVNIAGVGTIDPTTFVSGLHVAQIAFSTIDKNMLVLDQRFGKGACAGDSGGPIYFSLPSTFQNSQLILAAIVQGPYKTVNTDCQTYGQGLIAGTAIDFILQTALENNVQPPQIF